MPTYGFTLIDKITTVSIISILVAIGLPSLTDQIQHSRVKVATQSLLESLELTRTRAVFSNKRTTIRKRSNWENGWEIFIDQDNDGICDINEKVVKRQEKLKGVRVIANRPFNNYVSFVGSGEGRYATGGSNNGGFQAGTFIICPERIGKGYKLIIARGGRVRASEIDSETCASI